MRLCFVLILKWTVWKNIVVKISFQISFYHADKHCVLCFFICMYWHDETALWHCRYCFQLICWTLHLQTINQYSVLNDSGNPTVLILLGLFWILHIKKIQVIRNYWSMNYFNINYLLWPPYNYFDVI